MRTTLELDDDLVTTAKEMARQQGATLGQVISELARLSLTAQSPQKVRNGALVFTAKAGAGQSDLRVVNELRDEE